jgi:hypothetical protein
MYRNCIFCSAEFGSNDALEAFPVGRRLAFDGWRGRLWAVCPACARWNLAPIEERWETVEEAEKLFRDARLRVQSENVGLAKLPDGTQLVRVGSAVTGELAAWRYGSQLLKRRKRYLVAGGVGSIAGFAAVGGIHALGIGLGGVYLGVQALQSRWHRKVIYRVRASEDPEGRNLTIRRWHLRGMRLSGLASDGRMNLEIRDVARKNYRKIDLRTAQISVVSGDTARAVLARAMVHVNKKGATQASLKEADRILADAGSAEHILREAAQRGAALGDEAGGGAAGVLMGPGALAFEMALNEESERRALEGELAALEAAWKEAEEIAAIADSLPGEATLNRLLDRLIR